MNGMRIKSHKPTFTKTNLPRPERYVRYTPLGAIRLLPPISVANVVAATKVSKSIEPTVMASAKKRAAKSPPAKKAATRKRRPTRKPK